MKERISEDIYIRIKESINNNKPLNDDLVKIISEAMKKWALENGATHYTHWFFPLNGITAGKHDSFLELLDEEPLLVFNENNLKQGESDASTFPSGGLRATFEARGYTTWDCTTPAFIKNNSLYIPTLFYSYNGEALDDKIPLLKSLSALNKQVVNLFKKITRQKITKVTSFVGAEQEYFLIPLDLYNKRIDLQFTGRTIFGLNYPKEQKIEDHYCKRINQKVSKFMKELDEELWKYGIPAKTRHNEAAPSQFEIACIYREVTESVNNNHLLMELLDEIAEKNGFKCLLHEKPFKGINGSGKHNNWSIIADNNLNLFKPDFNMKTNLPFLITLSCLIRGIDEYSDLLRLSIASYENDFRLGGNEAPPTIISMYLGKELEDLISAITTNHNFEVSKNKELNTGINVIANFLKDNNDRNRTSPFALSGNKFEFRGVGSSQSLAFVNTVLNTILAYEIKQFKTDSDKGKKHLEIIKENLINHKRIIFNGDGYSKEWIIEAKKRGLKNSHSTIEAINCLKNKKIRNMFINLEILSQREIDSRYQILLNNYCKSIQVEAFIALKMIKIQIYPACITYLKELNETIYLLNKNYIQYDYLTKDVKYLSQLLNSLKIKSIELEKAIFKTKNQKNDILIKEMLWYNNVLPKILDIRKVVDHLESIVSSKYWPIPSYIDLLFSL